MTREKFKFDFPPLKKISQKTSLMLINTDDAIDVPEPLQPNMIQVGGLQITDTKPLPQVFLLISNYADGALKFFSRKWKLSSRMGRRVQF